MAQSENCANEREASDQCMLAAWLLRAYFAMVRVNLQRCFFGVCSKLLSFEKPLLPRLRRRLVRRHILYQNSNILNATAKFLRERVERLLDYLDLFPTKTEPCSLADIATLGFAISFMTSASVSLADCFLVFFLLIVQWQSRAAEELLVRSHQATVSMRLRAWLASGKLTLLSGLSTTSGTWNR